MKSILIGLLLIILFLIIVTAIAIMTINLARNIRPKHQTYEIDADGNKFWRNKEGQYHREDGPAVEHKNGSQYWYINERRHRDNGPAYIGITSRKVYQKWFFEGEQIE